MRRWKTSASIVADKPGWYALYYTKGHWREVTYTSAPDEPIRFVHSKDAMNAARQHAEATKCTQQ